MKNTTEVLIAVEQDSEGRDIGIGFMMTANQMTLEQKRVKAQRAIDTGAYRNWSGSNRVKIIDQARAKGHTVQLRVFKQVDSTPGCAIL